MEHLESGSNIGSSRLEALIGALFSIIVDVPLKNCTYHIHLEAVTCLLIFLSVEMHSRRRADKLNVYRLIMCGKHAIHAPLLMKNLLQNFIDQKKLPPGFTENQSNSLVVGTYMYMYIYM